jgi:hypothetical protein
VGCPGGWKLYQRSRREKQRGPYIYIEVLFTYSCYCWFLPSWCPLGYICTNLFGASWSVLDSCDVITCLYFFKKKTQVRLDACWHRLHQGLTLTL